MADEFPALTEGLLPDGADVSLVLNLQHHHHCALNDRNLSCPFLCLMPRHMKHQAERWKKCNNGKCSHLLGFAKVL